MNKAKLHSTVMCTSRVCLIPEQFLNAAFLPEKQTPFILKCLDIHTNTGPTGPTHLVMCLPLCNLEVQDSLSPSGRSGGCLVLVVSFLDMSLLITCSYYCCFFHAEYPLQCDSQQSAAVNCPAAINRLATVNCPAAINCSATVK